ncbi:DUF1129 family protein [Macrococcus animalis]|uniref:DUF1129 family protein n=1 Tax=Macrococcus animalis TaxID=3395467 RepID=UPI0039BE5311
MSNLNEMNIEYVRKVNQLKPKNKKAFEYIANKITSKVTLSEDESDDLLLEILDDLIIAQKNGTSAESFFGDNLDGFVEDISEELPKRTLKSVILFGTFTFSNLMIIVTLIFGFADFIRWISVGKHIDIPILSATLIIIIFLLFSIFSVFIDSNTKNQNKTKRIITNLSLFLSYSVSYLILNLIKQAPYFNFPFYYSIIIAILLISLSIFIKRKYFPKKQFI